MSERKQRGMSGGDTEDERRKQRGCCARQTQRMSGGNTESVTLRRGTEDERFQPVNVQRMSGGLDTEDERRQYMAWHSSHQRHALPP